MGDTMTAGAVVAALARARQEDVMLAIEGYCTDPECPTREVEITVKDHYGDLVAMVERRGGLHCPVCGGRLKLHWVATRQQYAEQRDEDARCDVNAQMYRRDQQAAGANAALVAFTTMARLVDDRLPPTPPGWWDKEGGP
jgi:hypothetical protein